MYEVTTSEAKQLAEFIRLRRTALGLTFADLHCRSHVERWQLEGIEQGKLNDAGEPEVLRAIAFALGLSPVDLYEQIGRDWQLNRMTRVLRVSSGSVVETR